jgi:hypothetical protein
LTFKNYSATNGTKEKRRCWGPEIFQYFWRLRNRIVGPLSENKISGSGFLIGEMKDIQKALDDGFAYLKNLME